MTATGETDLPYPDADLSHQTRIAAPGDPILSTIPFDRYGPSSGSSAAAALVSGTAAMLLSTRPDLTAKDIERILRDTADPLPMPGFDDVWDCGRLNAARAAAHLTADYRDLAIRRIRLFSAVARPGERVKGFVVVENRGSTREREARLDLTWMAGSAVPIRIQQTGKLNLKPGVPRRVNIEFTAPNAPGVHGIRGMTLPSNG